MKKALFFVCTLLLFSEIAMGQTPSLNYSNLPLSFEVNQGQTDPRVRFLSRGRGYTLFLTLDAAMLSVRQPVKRQSVRVLGHKPGTSESANALALCVRFAGANPDLQVEGLDELRGKSNYFIGNNPAKWRTNVPTYAGVKYRDIYPGVDIAYHSDGGELEQDFIVGPGARVQTIRLLVEGAQRLSIDSQGNLAMHLHAAELLLRKPVIYQTQDGVKQLIDGHYVLKHKREVGFEVAAYDPKLPLIIDPVLSYSTYLGGASGPTVATGIAVDTPGNAYVTGFTNTVDFPTTAGSYQPTGTFGTTNAFISKISPDGESLIYSTYLGSSIIGTNTGTSAITVDTAGNVYVVGSTAATDFPTLNAFQTSCNQCLAGTDTFITKLNPTGTALLYSSYLGGSSRDFGNALAVDNLGGAYVTGDTISTDFPTTPGAIKTFCGTDGNCNANVNGPVSDAFVANFDTTRSGGASLVYSTYLGHSSSGLGIAVDSTANAYVTGVTTASDFPTTVGAFQQQCGGLGCSFLSADAFVSKINPTGTALVYSTFLGGSSSEIGYGIALDSVGNVYLTGTTQSSDFPVTPGAFQSVPVSGRFGFVTKLNPTGSALLYSTYLGGGTDANGFSEGDGIAVDGLGDAYVVGRTGATNFPTVNATQSNFGGGVSDIFVSKLNPVGSQLLFSTYLGGSDNDGSFAGWFEKAGLGVAVGSTGDVYVAGTTNSTDYPTTPGVIQPTLAGIVNAVVTRISGFSSTSGPPLLITPIPPALGVTATGISSSPTSSLSNPTQASTSEPITTGNGNYVYQHSDFTLPGRGMPVVFQRNYNSLDNYSGPLGANWTHSYNIALFQDVIGNITVKWGDGHGETYTLSGGNYLPQSGVFNALVKNGDGTFTLKRKDQTQFAFSATGKLTTIQDKNGNSVVMTYDGAGNLTRITDPIGRNLNLAYDSSNHIAQITDPIGRAVSYQYDGSNNLVQESDTAGGITTFTYDANHRVTSITQPNGQSLLQNAYDSSGRVVSQTGGRGFATTLAYGAPNPSDTTITDARGNATIHSYDASLRIIRITDALGGTTNFTYDANNDRATLTNQSGKITNFSYDSQGNIIGIVDPLGNTVSFTYDGRNDLLTATNAKGKTTSFVYDANGNLVRIHDALANATAFNYDSFGELSSKTDARGNTTNYVYDSFGNLTRITDALGHSTNLTYDGIGRLTSITDPNSHAAIASYDPLSRLTKISDPLGNQTQFAYDSVGNLLKITDANGNATKYAYDATNNLVTVTDALGHVTRYAYDANNNRTTFTNAKGNATAYAYDAVNRLTRITDPLSFVTAYTYDAVGSVLAVKDAKGQTSQFTYDALNRLLGIAYGDGKNVAYNYDANGNRASMVDARGTTAYAYDALDRLTSVTQPGGKVVAYAFDAVGNRKSIIYPDGKTVNYAYDQANRLSQVTDWLNRLTTYSYDSASNVTGVAYPNGASVGFSYDAANRLLNVGNAYQGSLGNPISNFAYVLDAVGNRRAVTDGSGKTSAYLYDALNQLNSVTVETIVAAYAYDAVGNRMMLTAPGTSVSYTYDAADRLLAAGNTTFGYDNNGNQTVKTPPNGKPIAYSYDAANRLISVVSGKTNNGFSYDGDGNRVSQTTGSGTYTYVNDVASALPVVLQESGPDGNISYVYGLGLISESGPGFDFFYQYDGLGSVVGLTDPSGKLLGRYSYDAWGQTDLTAPAPQLGTKNKFRFTGEALDPGTQLYYLRARYYDPSVGRFLSLDRLGGVPLFPITLNKFMYALNRPTKLSDPTGLSSALPGVTPASSSLPSVAPFVRVSFSTNSASTNADSTVPLSPDVGQPSPAPLTPAEEQQVNIRFAQLKAQQNPAQQEGTLDWNLRLEACYQLYGSRCQSEAKLSTFDKINLVFGIINTYGGVAIDLKNPQSNQ